MMGQSLYSFIHIISHFKIGVYGAELDTVTVVKARSVMCIARSVVWLFCTRNAISLEKRSYRKRIVDKITVAMAYNKYAIDKHWHNLFGPHEH